MASSAASTVTQPSKRKSAPAADGVAGKLTTDAPAESKERDFFWTYTEEPHRTRRLAIIKAHPEVRWTYRPFSTGSRNHGQMGQCLVLVFQGN